MYVNYFAVSSGTWSWAESLLSFVAPSAENTKVTKSVETTIVKKHNWVE